MPADRRRMFNNLKIMSKHKQFFIKWLEIAMNMPVEDESKHIKVADFEILSYGDESEMDKGIFNALEVCVTTDKGKKIDVQINLNDYQKIEEEYLQEEEKQNC